MSLGAHLKSLQALELAARLGSLTKAAEVLSITPAAVGQRIRSLEEYLGVELVVRGRLGLRPTAELEGALPHLKAAFAELDAAGEQLQLQRRDEIHIAASSDWVELWLAPRLPVFRHAYPNIRFSINGEGDAEPRLGHTDLTVDFGAACDNPDCDVLFADYLVPLSSPENRRRLARLRRRDKLEGFPLLHLDFYRNDPAALDWPSWIARYGLRKTAFDRGMRFQRVTDGLESVASNSGLMICGIAMLQTQLTGAGLVAPFALGRGEWTAHGFCARYRPGSARSKALRSFRHWLKSEAADTMRWLSATVPPPAADTRAGTA
jgi:LysR family glycine cleavage system transcriptional activator